MNDRVEKLRKQSLETEPEISIERALLTEAYREYEGTVSIPVLRALAFKELMENKAICINEGELIVGERGERPQSTSTYPEICCHTLEDLELIKSREKIAFKVGEKVKRRQEEIISFWENRSIRSRLFNEMTPEWLDCYEAGLFTDLKIVRKGNWIEDRRFNRISFSLNGTAISEVVMMKMNKRRIKKDDGRYLIYYTFDKSDDVKDSNEWENREDF